MSNLIHRISVLLVSIILCMVMPASLFAQQQEMDKFKKASRKLERAIAADNRDSLAKAFEELGDSYYQKGVLQKSEDYYAKAKGIYEKTGNAEGLSRSSRALAKVQEDQNKKKDAILNYKEAKANSEKSGDKDAIELNQNDIKRLSMPDSTTVQSEALEANIDILEKSKDTQELINNYGRMGTFNLQQNMPIAAATSFSNAYTLSKNNPEQARRYNQLLTNSYVANKDLNKAIATKKELLQEPFIKNSTQATATELNSLASIYILKMEDTTAINLLQQSYQLAADNGHTIEAKSSIEKLDSVYQHKNNKDKSLALYRDFIKRLPAIVEKDSSLTNSKIVTETEKRLQALEAEKIANDELIRKKNLLNFWLIGSIAGLTAIVFFILFILKKLRRKNKKIALQSLRREMNPHFIFNSLNSINQFIASNNEMEANQYLSKFSTLMRGVMENSTNDFVLFGKEIDLLRNYLELERSRFPDKFNFSLRIDDALYADEQQYIPGMLIQPYLENAIWHGLRYMDEKGSLLLSFIPQGKTLKIVIEDNGIGMEASRQHKTSNQKKHHGRGIKNTEERIAILNELYQQDISCLIEDKPAPDHGVKVILSVPLLKQMPA